MKASIHPYRYLLILDITSGPGRQEGHVYFFGIGLIREGIPGLGLLTT